MMCLFLQACIYNKESEKQNPILHQQEYYTRAQRIEMLKEEQKVRYSNNIQNIYTEQYYAQENNPNYERINIEREIQKYILRKYGFKDDEKSLKEYWKIPSTYWNDEDVKNSIFYMKLNIFQNSILNIGDKMIDARLIDYTTDDFVSLSSLQKENRPLVILAGSMT